MELTYKTCYECSKIKEDDLLKYMQLTPNPLIFEFINKLTADMLMQQFECYTCPPFTIEMYCDAALKTYFKNNKAPRPTTTFGRFWEEATEEEKQEFKKFLESTKKGKLPPIEPSYDTAIIDNIVI